MILLFVVYNGMNLILWVLYIEGGGKVEGSDFWIFVENISINIEGFLMVSGYGYRYVDGMG